MKEKRREGIRFGISTRLSFAIGLIIVVTASISFLIAAYLHHLLTIATVLDKNRGIASDLVEEIGENNIAVLLEQEQSVYNGLSEEERADPMDEAYQSKYDMQDTPEYEKVFGQIDQSIYSSNTMWVDLRFKDEDRNRYVYLLRTDAKGGSKYDIGYWEAIDDKMELDVVTRGIIEDDQNMKVFPQWVGTLSDKLLKSVRRIPKIIDTLLQLNLRSSPDLFAVLYPIHSQSGETVGYMGIGEYYTNYMTYNAAFVIVFAVVFIPYFMIITLVARTIVRRDIVRPIQELANAAVAYGAEEDILQSGLHFKNIAILSHDEVLLLRDSMSDMEEKLIQYMNNLTRMTAKQERLKTEMDMSARIQMGVLPDSMEEDGTERDYTIYASIRPAKDVGGDFYDFFTIDDERIGIVMADVSGKGIPAAMFMMMAKLLLEIAAKDGASPVDIMRRANQKLCDNNPEMFFVTIWFGIYHTRERTIRYVNAGHEYPAVFRQSEGKYSLLEGENDFVAGFEPDIEFTERQMVLEPGDKLFLYTDGIPEAHNSEGELYGIDRMLAALNRCVGYTSKEFFDNFTKDVFGFMGEAEQFDDMTMLLLELQ
ncbi:MAG: PP2C family protein-serine/threonine phosphatase [Lachnospiraceae bacterium]|nr:PP2C family protein-serine/threonine phosphatase [Lachnospiraceae bacterium]